jgi:predicted O-linked N-acetylglucosamine transferase (SPINDLY family)
MRINEAAWTVAPVVAPGGETHASRAGISPLSVYGLPDLIAKTGNAE